MSSTQIVFTFRVGAVLTDVTSAVLSDPTGAFGVRRLDTLAVVVADGTAMTHDGVGLYSHTFTDPAADLTYNYWVEFVYLGNTYRIEQDISGSTSVAIPAGSGAGGGVIPVASALIDETYSAVKLATFAQLAGYSEDQFFGLNNSLTQQAACNPIWSHAERAMVARYLAEAQAELENLLRYPLYPRWFINEQHPYGYPVHSVWGKVVEAGFRNTTMLQADAVPSYVTDPAVISVPTSATDGITVFHPNTEIEIYPSSLTVAGGVATILIPRARLVKESAQNNPEDGWTYADVPPSATSPFEATVDVVRVYNDTSIQAAVVWSHQDSTCDACCPTCSEHAENACIYVRNYDTGAMDILPATYSAGGWTSVLCTSCYCENPDILRLNYRAGLTVLPSDLQEAIIQLALAKMPGSPCGCGVIKDWWTLANVEVITDKMAFGMRKAGAFRAMDSAKVLSLKRGFVLG